MATLSRFEYWLTTPISVLWRDVQDGQISAKLVRVFGLQILAISLAAGVGIWIATRAVENIILQQTLSGEANYFWQQLEENPDHPLPNTKNLTAYLDTGAGNDSIPGQLQQRSPGFGRVDLPGREQSLIYIADNDEQRLYLVLNRLQIWQISFLFGIAPLAGALLVIYFLTWLGYISSKRALSPLVKLAQRVEQYDYKHSKLSDLKFADIAPEADVETLSLLRAFEHFTQRLESMIERERLFTRNASHELRTPIAVIKGNLDLLKHRADDPRMREQSVQRMDRAINDMQGLIETLLLLARVDEQGQSDKPVDMASLLSKTLENEAALVRKQGVKFSLIAEQSLKLHAPEKVLSIVFANLIRNAFSYTSKGSVKVTVSGRNVSIADTGIGMDETELKHAFEPFYRGERHDTVGYGLGLALVAKLCNRYEWPVSIQSEPDQGTRITVTFARQQLYSE